MLLVGTFCLFSNNVSYAQEYSDINSDGRIIKSTDDCIFNWVNRQERVSSSGDFNFNFSKGLASDKFTLTS